MIDLYNLVPTIYSSASRDFQYLTWLFNIVLNGVKHNVDDLYNLPNNNEDPKVQELLALTLGFKVKRNYDQKQLKALVNVLPILFRCKGTDKAIETAASALVLASGVSGEVDCELKDGTLKVTIPEGLTDITLFTDLLPYILPAGLPCRIVRQTIEEEKSITQINYRDHYLGDWELDLGWDLENNTSEGLANMFIPGTVAPNFANYAYDADTGTKTLNTGLMDNTIIPTLDYNSTKVPKPE